LIERLSSAKRVSGHGSLVTAFFLDSFFSRLL
jgi:hypothetical protein